MGLLDFFTGKLTGTINPKKLTIVENLAAEVVYKKLAIDSCVDLIANSILKTEFETYKKGKKERKSLYYMLNVKPNKNMNQKNFLKKIVYKLLYENECLIIQTGDKELVIADEFVREERGIEENRYSFVTVGTCQFNKTFLESNVIYLTYYEDTIMGCIDRLYVSYGKLLSSAMNIYKRSNAKRYIMKGEFLRRQDDGYQKALNDMINQQMKPWLEADNAGAVFQLPEKYSMEDSNGSSKSSIITSKDTREVIDQFYDIVARAFHLPKGLLKGETVELSGQVDAMLNFISIPIVELIVSEVNGKLYSEADFLERTYLRASTHRLKTTDMSTQATSIDKLFQIGVLCIDDAIEMLGGEPFNEEWSQKRYVTKNYADATSVEQSKGGDGNESRNETTGQTTTTSD